MHRRKQARTPGRRKAFTLIELVVVIAILVILTGMVLAKLDVFEMKANKGVAAANMSDVARAVMQYRALTTTYPDGWDSLLDQAGHLPQSSPATPTTPAVPGLHGELTGGPPFQGNPVELTTGTLLNGEIQSLGREGINTLYDFPGTKPTDYQAWTDIPGNMPGSAPNLARTLSSLINGTTPNAPSTATVARLNTSMTLPGDGVTLQTITPSTDPRNKADTVVADIYKTAGGGVIVPLNKSLVVVGFGQFNQAVGNRSQNSLMPQAPFYPNENQVTLYNRFLCVFETDVTGVRARLVAVLGADGDRMDDEIGDYYATAP